MREIIGKNLEYLQLYVRTLQAFSAWPEYENQRFFKLRAVLQTPFYVLLGVSAIYHLAYNLISGCNLSIDVITEDIYLVFVTSFAEFMILTAIFKQKQILNVMKIVGDYSGFGQPKNAIETEKKLTFYLKIFICYSFAVGILYFLLSELFREDFPSSEEEGKCGELPYIMVPFKIPDFLQIELLYNILQGISTIYMYAICGTTFLIFFAVLRMTIIKIEHLQSLIRKCFDNNCPKIQKRNLYHCIRYHIHISKTVKVINECYSRSLLVIITVMALFIGMDGYMFLQMRTYKYLGHMSSNLISVFIICIICQSLIDKSEDLTRDIYNILWYKQPVALQKDVLFMLLRSQKELSINADGFSIISNLTFSYILNTTFSILAFLNSTTKEED